MVSRFVAGFTEPSAWRTDSARSSGRWSLTASPRPTRPSSYSVRSPTLVTIFVADAIRNRLSVVMRRRDSASANPNAFSVPTCPSRASSSTAPGSRLSTT